MTREELAVTMIRALKLKGYDEASNGQQSLSFKDKIDISIWALPSVQQAVALGLLKGENGYFAPKRSTSRQEMAVIAMRATDTIQVLEAMDSEQEGSDSQIPNDNSGKVTETQGTITGTAGTEKVQGATAILEQRRAEHQVEEAEDRLIRVIRLIQPTRLLQEPTILLQSLLREVCLLRN